jgi:chromosome segregation ATPase
MNGKSIRSSLAAAALIAALAGLGVACTEADAPADTPSAIPTTEGARGELPAPNGEANDRDEFITTTLAQIEQIEVQLEEIEAEVETAGAPDDVQARIDDVKERIAASQADLVEVPMLSEDDYASLQQTIEEALATAMTETQALVEELGI